MPKGKSNRKKTKTRRKRKTKKIAGDTFSRTFKYPDLLIKIPALSGTEIESWNVTTATHAMDNGGLAAASVFLKYYQFFRIKKVYMNIKCVSREIELTNQGQTSASTAGWDQGQVTLTIVPFRDGISVGNMNSAKLFKLMQYKGARTFTRPVQQLIDGFDYAYTPNTLDIGFESQGAAPVIIYNNYKPQYGQWYSNNDMSTLHYGMMVIVHQATYNQFNFQIKQSLMIQYKYKCDDPLITYEEQTTENSTENVVSTADIAYRHIITDHRAVVVTGALANENEDNPEDGDNITDLVEGIDTVPFPSE